MGATAPFFCEDKMALTTYADLKASIERWTHRYDIDLLAEDIISLAEATMYTGATPLKTLEMLQRSTLSVVTGETTTAFPDGLIELLEVRIDYGDGVLRRIDNVPAYSFASKTTEGNATAYTINSAIELDRPAPAPGATLSALYYARPTPLSDDNPTNAMLTKYPNIYLAACNSAAYEYAKEPDLADRWGAIYLNARNDANSAAKLLGMGAAPTIHHADSTYWSVP